MIGEACLTNPNSTGSRSFSVGRIVSFKLHRDSQARPVEDLPKKEMIMARLHVPEAMSPKIKMGAASSPREKFSTFAVNLYSGFVALDTTCLKTLPMASWLASRVSFVQKAIVVSNTDWLKTWLLPKRASDRL